jgi:hypothetical protein
MQNHAAEICHTATNIFDERSEDKKTSNETPVIVPSKVVQEI